MTEPFASPEIALLKAQVVAACHILSRERLVAAFGHVSARIPGTEFLIVSPRIGPGAATVDALLIIDLDGRPRLGESRPPIELPIHTTIYRGDPRVGAICRIHGEAASVLSVANVPVRPLHFLGTILGGEVPVHDFGDLITDEARGEAVAQAIRGRLALLLRGNGQVVLGRSVPEACVRAIYLEEAARIQAQAMAAGAPRYYTHDEAAAYAGAWDDPVNIERVWNFYAAMTGPGGP